MVEEKELNFLDYEQRKEAERERFLLHSVRILTLMLRGQLWGEI
jgi:hypothetical protein